MRFRTVIILILVAFFGYIGYGYATAHFNRASIVYKGFAAAVVRNDPDKARFFAWDNAAQAPFAYATQRNKDLLQGQIKLEYFNIDSVYYSADGNTATISATHTVRVDPPGATTVFGAQSFSFPERVQVEQRDGLWKVARFDDSYSLDALKEGR